VTTVMISRILNCRCSFFHFLLAAVMVVGASPINARPVFDPFCQKFQVGSYSDPDKLELASGYPAGLLESASLDTVWTANAREILSLSPDGESPLLTLRLLAGMAPSKTGESWLQWHRLRVNQLVSWQDTLVTGGNYLLADRLTMGFFRAINSGDLKTGRKIARRLAKNGVELGLSGRDVFVWHLRGRLLSKLLADNPDESPLFWDSLLNLGSYDRGNAWVLWTAHRRQLDLPAFPRSLKTKKTATKLATLRNSWVKGSDLEASAFPQEIKAGLGAVLLKNEQLNLHLGRYPDPPKDFSVQGWWVSGQRASRKGQTGFYEELARRPDLNAGWRMDLFRRASEIHLLNGRWEPGQKNLESALDLAGEKAGTKGQRLRLRQWTEQAIVLALAKDKTATARSIYDLGINALPEKELNAFLRETAQWKAEIGLEKNETVKHRSRKENASMMVLGGSVLPIQALGDEGRGMFLKATETPLWGLWARWGLGLVPADGSNPVLDTYRGLLAQCLKEPSPDIQNALVVEAVSLMLADRLDQEPLLRWVLDKDIHRRSQGRSLMSVSPISGLAKKKLGDHAALHAMLGLALLVDDLRGIVGVATPMPGTGLTTEQKLCFLYPLPGGGSIHTALSKADNDPALLLAVARNESLFEPSVRSRAGALGWMQIMPFHFSDRGARPGVDNWSHPGVSIAKGDRLLTENRRRYQGNPFLTLAAYNAGPGATARWQKQLGDNTRDDIFLAWIGYPETRRYVEKVLIDREIYDWIIKESRFAH
jgi:Transglycosylase SLT domain